MTNAGMMTTNLKAKFSSYGTVWFDPQAMTNVLSFGNIAKQYPIGYLQESDTFQVQLHNHINIFGMNRLITCMFWKEINPERNLNKPLIPKRCFPSISNITCPNH